MNQFWNWFEGPLVDGLNSFSWENPNEESTETGTGHRVVGAIQLRQLRTKSHKCNSKQFGETVKNCYSSTFHEDKESFGPSQIYKWDQNSGEHAVWGKFNDIYPGSGFVVTFVPNKTSVLEISSDLKLNEWIDINTRVVMVSFTIYNPNINMLSAMRFILEFTASGNGVSYSQISTVKALKYNDSFDAFLAFIEIVIILYFFVEFILAEIYEINHLRWKYLSSFWNYWELLSITVSITFINNFYFTFP
jgi:hypothetical protein